MDKQNVRLYLAHKWWAMIQIININKYLESVDENCQPICSGGLARFTKHLQL